MTMKEHRKLIWSFFSSLALVIPVALLPGCGKDDEPVHLGLDLSAGGACLTYRVDWDEALEGGIITQDQYESRDELVRQVIEILRERVDPSGERELFWEIEGKDRFVVQIPADPADADDTEQVRSRIETRGLLQFLIAAEEGDFPPGTSLTGERTRAEEWRRANPEAPWSVYNESLATGDQKTHDLRVFPRRVVDRETGQVQPAGIELLWNQKEEWTFTDADLLSVYPTTDRMGYPVLGLELDPGRGADFSEFTTEYIDRGLAIVIDGVIVSLATIRTTLGTEFIIDGPFSAADIGAMLSLLRSGSLVVTPVLESVEQVVPGANQSGD